MRLRSARSVSFFASLRGVSLSLLDKVMSFGRVSAVAHHHPNLRDMRQNEFPGILIFIKRDAHILLLMCYGCLVGLSGALGKNAVVKDRLSVVDEDAADTYFPALGVNEIDGV